MKNYEREYYCTPILKECLRENGVNYKITFLLLKLPMNDSYEINWKIYEPPTPSPKLLFKYRDLGNELHLQTLTESTIFLPSATRFNDPFDCKIPLEYLKLETDEKLRRNYARKLIMMYGNEQEKNKIEDHVESFMAKKYMTNREELLRLEERDIKRLSEFGIYSVSIVPNNLLLWSHYANSHTGICIGFNTKKLFNNCNFSSLGPVTYFDKYPNMSLLRDNEDLYYNQIYNKSIDWRHELEFRYVKIKGADTKVKFTPDTIEEIYIGCMASLESISLIEQLRKNTFPHVKLYKCKQSRNGYFLEREEI